jgi:ADP-ribose pyrophosphatase
VALLPNGQSGAGINSMDKLFVYGTLCHLPLLEKILGRLPDIRKALLPDHAAYWAQGHDFPVILPQNGKVAPGLLLSGLTPGDLVRLDYYEGPFEYFCAEKQVRCDDGPTEAALVYFADPDLWQAGAPWDLAAWQAQWGDIIVATADDIMALYPAPIAPHRRFPMLVRGASRLRAAVPTANALRGAIDPKAVAVTRNRQVYANFFAIEEYDLSFRRFDGAQSPVINRAAFVSGDAVTVLPYDPKRDRVLIVEQFRAGPFARGDVQPWQLEPIAGRIDPGETPQQAGRREAEEEAGLRLETLLPIANYYPSPGAKTEFLYSYLALTDLPDGTAIIGGEASEAEDIKGHLISFDALMQLVASGEATNAPLILSALWLQRERPRLRAL